MATLKILIEESHKHPAGKLTTLCRTSIEFNDSVQFPFENIMSSFRTLYPTKQLIFNFTII